VGGDYERLERRLKGDKSVAMWTNLEDDLLTRYRELKRKKGKSEVQVRKKYLGLR